MHFCLGTTAALALLSAESLFLGASGAPLGLSREREIGSISNRSSCRPGYIWTTEGCVGFPEKRAGGGGRLVGVGEGKGGSKGDDGSSSGGAGKSGSNKGDEGSSGPNPGSFKDIGEPKKTYPPKAITDPFDGTYKYRLEDSKSDPDDHIMDYGQLYDVKSEYYEKWDKPVDTIGIRKDDNSINTLEAFNKDQTFEGGMQYKDHPVRLSDIQMYLFVNKGGKRPQDLSIMRYDSIVESKTDGVMAAALEKFPNPSGASDNEITVTSKAAKDSDEYNIFQQMLKTPIGMNVDKTVQQFGVGKQIQSFKIQEKGSALHLEVNLG
ncbi:hypothetical protein PG984_015695 [Apiospora sp. TS-2023a]